jgi:hypothetical protein
MATVRLTVSKCMLQAIGADTLVDKPYASDMSSTSVVSNAMQRAVYSHRQL